VNRTPATEPRVPPQCLNPTSILTSGGNPGSPGAGGCFDDRAVKLYVLLVKTTIDLPDDLLYRAKIVAAQRKTTLKELVQTGLDWVLRSDTAASDRDEALAQLRKGLHLGGKPLTREQTHERR